MVKSLTNKIAKQSAKQAIANTKKDGGSSKEVSKHNDIKKQNLKVKKTAGSIQKKKTARTSDLDELKQLLKLEPPKIDLSLFDSALHVTGTGEDKPRVKKPNAKKRATMRLLRDHDKTMQLVRNPKNIVQRLGDQIRAGMKSEQVAAMSRGQTKRLEKKIAKFASKNALDVRGRELREEQRAAQREKNKAVAEKRQAEQKLNEGFMDVDDDEGMSDVKKDALQKFDDMGNMLNQIGKQQSKEQNETKQKQKMQTKMNKRNAKEEQARAEMQRLHKIGSIPSFSNSEFALDAIFQHVQNTSLQNQSSVQEKKAAVKK